MQKTTDDYKSDDITEVCTNHRAKLLDFYCNTHKSVACYVCVTLEHKQCKVDFIPDVSGNVSYELKDIVITMDGLVKKCESNIRKAQSATRNLDQNQEKVIEEIKLFREEINNHLDQMESRMIQETEYFVKTAKYKLEIVKDASLEIKEELKCLQSFLNSLSEENKKNTLFIDMKKVEPRLMTLTDKEIKTLENNETDDGIEFFRNTKIFDKLKVKRNFGMIFPYNNPSEDKGLYLQYERTINLKSSSDKENCKGCGMSLVFASKMVVADYFNKKIKMIDMHNGSLVSEITLPSEPRDIIKLPHNKLAVALHYEKCIQKVTYTDTSLSLDRRIEVGESCYCVAYCQDKLIVGCDYNPGKLVILDLDGNIKQVFDTPGLFAGPEKIIISSDEKFLFISDDNSVDIRRCIKMDFQGNIAQRFEQPGYNRPMGIKVLEDATLLVCYWQSNKIVRLSSSFKINEIIGLGKANQLHRPRTLVYSVKDHKLYVSCESVNDEDGLIKVFHVKWV